MNDTFRQKTVYLRCSLTLGSYVRPPNPVIESNRVLITRFRTSISQSHFVRDNSETALCRLPLPHQLLSRLLFFLVSANLSLGLNFVCRESNRGSRDKWPETNSVGVKLVPTAGLRKGFIETYLFLFLCAWNVKNMCDVEFSFADETLAEPRRGN